jgi:hypothetical protein
LIALNGTANFSLRFADRELKRVFFLQDEVPLTAPCATPKPKPFNLEECILCQKKKRSEYLSSGEIGRVTIVSLAKQTKTNHT